MPSQHHEVLVEIFRTRPDLAPELLRTVECEVELPAYRAVRIGSSDAADVMPAQYHADLVVLLEGDDARPVYGIVVEAQLHTDDRKRFTWPAYAANLRARHECGFGVLAVCASETVAQWASTPIRLDGKNKYEPFVIGPSRVPYVTDATTAAADPELAVLSAIAHGADPDATKAEAVVRAALSAITSLDRDRMTMYFDRIAASMAQAVRKELLDMDLTKYEYESEFAKHFLAKGREEGREEGREQALRAVLVTQLTQRFGEIPALLADRLRSATDPELERFAERVFAANRIDDVFSSEPLPS